MLHFFAMVTATLAVAAADSTAPQWESDYATALAQTRQDDRPLLVVIDQPGVDGQSIQQSLLTGSADGKLADYDLCHVDASTKYGKKVADAFKADAFPYVAFVDKGGKVILHQHAGSLDSTEWTKLVGKYHTGVVPTRHVVAKPTVRTSTISASAPVQSYPSYQPYNASPRPYCAKCQRGY